MASEVLRICILKVKRELSCSGHQLLLLKLNIEFLRGRKLDTWLVAAGNELAALKEVTLMPGGSLSA